MALSFYSKRNILAWVCGFGVLLSGCQWRPLNSKGESTAQVAATKRLGSFCGDGLCALVFLSAECPICQNQVLTLNQLMKKYPQVHFKGVFTAWDKWRDIKTFQTTFAPAFHLGRDDHHRLAKRLDATVTPEVFLLHKGQIVYQGAIDNWYYAPGRHRVAPTAHYLEDAIRAVQNGGPVSPAKTEAIGCIIER